jgi:hypothetical protein
MEEVVAHAEARRKGQEHERDQRNDSPNDRERERRVGLFGSTWRRWIALVGRSTRETEVFAVPIKSERMIAFRSTPAARRSR